MIIKPIKLDLDNFGGSLAIGLDFVTQKSKCIVQIDYQH